MKKNLLLFIACLAAEALLMLSLRTGARVPPYHDGFIYFSLQYYFLNDTFFSKEVPQWIPYITHGNIATMWFGLTAGMGQQIVLTLARWVSWLPSFLTVFYGNMFLNMIVLLTGLWFFMKRLGVGPMGRCFVGFTVCGSSIWISQPGFNLFFYYALPWILYFTLRFWDTGRWRYVFGAGHLLAFQSLGNVAYFLPVQSLVIVMFNAFYLGLNGKKTGGILSRLRKGSSLCPAAALIGVGVSFGVIRFLWTAGMDDVVYNTVGRSSQGLLSLDEFLNFGGHSGWWKWGELVLRMSPALDYTLYIGIAALPLAFLGVGYKRERMGLCLLLIVLFLMIFSAGSWMTAFFYYTWPYMKYYRHVELVSPIIRLFLCFLAGLGWEAVMTAVGGRAPSEKADRQRPRSETIVISLGILSAVILCLFMMARLMGDQEETLALLRKMVPKELPVVGLFEQIDQKFWSVRSDENPIRLIYTSERIKQRLSAASLLIVLSSFWGLGLLLIKDKTIRLGLMAMLLTVQAFDMIHYKWAETTLRSRRLSPQTAGLLDYQPIPYLPRRKDGFLSASSRAVLSSLAFSNVGIKHCVVYPFVHLDSFDSLFRTDFQLASIEALAKAFPRKNNGIKTQLVMPRTPVVMKLGGRSEDKIQFFSNALLVPPHWVGPLMRSPIYQGDIPILSSLRHEVDGRRLISLLSMNARRHYNYQVTRFDSNNLWIKVVIPSHREQTWLFYSDAWHPAWTAWVNGKKTPIYRANLAYKAVPLQKGRNDVRFHFSFPGWGFAQTVMAFDALGWLVWLIASFRGILWDDFI